jgi:hypothetical protein
LSPTLSKYRASIEIRNTVVELHRKFIKESFLPILTEHSDNIRGHFISTPVTRQSASMTVALQEMQPDLTNGAVKEQDQIPAARIPSPVPNHGSTVPDLDAMPDNEPASVWRERNCVDPSKQIKLVKLAHMRYQHPDLEEITIFMKDFGMSVVKKTENAVWYRGYGPDQYVYYAQKGERKFLGGAFEVESYQDLEKYVY